MKKLLPLLLLVFLARPALAADDKTESGLGFWEMLRMKIEQFTPQKKLNTTTAVGGVRGAPVQANEIYWKGETKPQSIDADEYVSFQKAVTLVEGDQKDLARAAFAEFAKVYPTSPLRPDAEKALTQLQPGK
jgi:TolA-binding protein